MTFHRSLLPMKGLSIYKHTALFIAVLLVLFNIESFAQENSNIVIYAKLKSTDTEILQPWSTAFLADRDYPATMLAPVRYAHIIPSAKNTFTFYQIFQKERPDILEIHLNNSANIQHALEELQKHPLVEYAEVDTYVQDLQSVDEYTPNDPSLTSQYNVFNHNLKQAWAITKGSNEVVIGIHDSGFEINHEDLIGNMKVNEAELNGNPGIDDDGNGYIDDIYGYNFANNSNDLQTSSNHGTEVAGTAAATPDNEVGIAGMGFNSKMIFAVRSSLSSLVYLAENGANIINMSWGGVNFISNAYQDVINHYTEDPEYDVLFIAASGNLNHNQVLTNYYPASYDNVMSISAVDRDKNNQDFTKSYNITMSATDNSLSTTANNGYKHTSGTSYASPTVAGIAALVRAEYPELTAKQVSQLLRFSADTSYISIGDNAKDKYVYGYGLADAHRALTHKDSLHIVQAENIQYGHYLTRDITIAQGDTLAIWFDFRNMLNGNSGDLKAVLTSYSDSYTPITDTTFIGQMSEGQVISNRFTPFLFKISESANLQENVYFRINFEDINSNYVHKDWQNTHMNISLEQIINFNRISGTFRPDGTIGKEHGLNFYGPNASGNVEFYSNYHLTRQAGVILATKDNVSDAVYTDIDNNTRSTDFQGVTFPNYLREYSTDSLYPVLAYNMKYIDSKSGRPISFEVDQTYYSGRASNVNSDIFTELAIKNVSNATIDTLYAGLFMDWIMEYTTSTALDSLPPDSSIVDYDSDRRMIFVKHVNGKKYAAVTLLNEGEINIQAIDNTDSSNSDINITDGFSDEDKIKAVSSGIGTTQVGEEGTGTNTSSVISLSIPNLKADETARVGFLISAGDDLEQIHEHTENILPYAQYWLKGPAPQIGYLTAREGEIVNVRTDNFDSFALYKEVNGSKVFKGIGREFDLLIDSINYYYVQSQGRYVYYGDTVQLQGEAIPTLKVDPTIYSCYNSSIIIQPEGCDSYNFYKDRLLTQLAHTGNSLVLYDLQSDTSFWITCAERNIGIVDTVHTQIIIDSTFNDYTISDSVSYIDGNITATFDENQNAATWSWELDGIRIGEHNDVSITPTFTTEGMAQLRLYATNKAGCTYIISKEIEVKRDNPLSSVVSTLEEGKLYPNPVNDGVIYLALPRNLGMITFDLYTTDGRLLLDKIPYIITGSNYTIYLPKALQNQNCILKASSKYGSHTWQVSIQ
ncbi:S8 family serine peptidase [Flammeovirga aprica]|uniref:S8 family serine peptidase n=1 Tax=Flammeovirga aprica JL-4 TaxID=694437 RepID=A0A7X9XAY7_9BACT|nr:S8 family serine peptidase [Flammeovirga aprica]NME70165.1 S8 family serine peptidase [Flammeovirga aprica JL-4]